MRKVSNTNRLLSLVLCLCMVLTLLPASALSAFATGGTDPAAVYADTVSYIERSWDGTQVVSQTKTVTDYTVVTGSTTTMTDGWYVVNSDVTVSSRITVSGTVNLILADGYTLTASQGVRVVDENTLNIYGQSADTGAIRATGKKHYAGIGGGYASASSTYYSGTTIIHGGSVTACGGELASGIGGGADSTTIIYGGVIEANGGSFNYSWQGAAGIGGSTTNDNTDLGQASGDIDIYGGIVFAAGINGADDIGAGQGHAGMGSKDVTILGGLIFDRNGNGTMGGTSYTLEKSWELPSGKTLTIESGKTLIIPKGVILTTTGTLVNNGTIVTDCKASYDDQYNHSFAENAGYTDNGDGTHSYACTVCGPVTEDHTGGTATSCTTQAKCEHCGASYGEVDTTNHDSTVAFDSNGFCPNGCYEPATDSNADGVYEIGSAGQLYWFAQQVNSGKKSINALLINDIDLTNHTWTPIGVTAMGEGVTDGYTGTFDGQGHVISNITFAAPTSAMAAGIFGTVQSGGTVKNLGVENLTFDNNTYDHRAGGIAGQLLAGGTISDCYVSNSTVKASSRVVGGIVGMNKGTVKNCYTCNMTLAGYSNRFGGISGDYSGGKLENCYTDYSALASSQAGTATNCEAGVSAERFASGEVAYLLNGEQSEIVFKQTIGTDATPNFTGGTVYQVGVTCKEGAVAYANTQGDLTHHYKNGICTACGAYESATDSNADGVYEIGNAGQLYWFMEKVNAGETTVNGKLTADIVVNEGTMTADSTDAREWTPIGYANNYYAGTFDGCGFTISGLYFNNSGTNDVGLFGAVSGGTVKNVGVVDSYLSGKWYVGGVVGYIDKGTVEGCYNSGTVSGIADVGGVVGWVNTDSTVTNCYNTGNVSGSGNYVGGVVGNIANGTVEGCYNSGTVSGSGNYVGGVAGYIKNSNVTNSYNTGNVSGSGDYVGGVAGSNEGDSFTALSDVMGCYNSGTVSGNGNHVGSVVGYKNSCGFVTNCYYLADSETDSIDDTTFKTAEQFESGEVAYLLGEPFGQTIGTDSYPVLKGAKVYEGTNCKDEVVYSNTDVSSTHTEQTVAGKAPTCTESGLTDGVICSVCGETLTAQEEISALGHGHTEGISYEEGDGTHDVFCDDCYTTIEWNVECTYSEDTHTCICGNVETFTIEWYDFGTFKSETYKYGETVIGPEPVSEVTDQGKNTFLFWYDLNDGSQVTLPMTMPAKNLQLEAAYSYTGWAGVIGSDYYTYWIDSMEVQGWFNVNENNEPVGEGEGTRYYAGEDYNVVNNVTLIDGIYYAFDRETGAFLSDYIGFYEARNGDCYYVTNGIAVAHNGHTEQTVPGYEATCTETGLTDGVKCSVCGETITAQEEIPATGHSFVNGGCENCDAEIQVSIPGSFNGWDTTAWIMARNEDGTYTYQVRLESGSYTFKIMDDGNWLGNNGTIHDHTYGYAWIFSDAGDCTLSASGGTYTFTYNINTKGLKVEAVLDHVHDYDLTFTWSDYYTTCVAAGSCGCGNSVSENCSIAKTLENGKLSFTATYGKYSDTVTVDADNTNVIYVDVSAMGWTNVNAYYWMSTSYQGVIDWPGIAMTHVRDSVYCIEVPVDCDRIIFNNGSAQTNDLNMPVNGENIAVVKSGNTTDFGYMEPLTYTLTFTDDPEFIMADWSYSITKPYGAPITEEDLAALEAAIPQVENYNVVDWYLTDGTWTEIPATMPGNDLTFYAYWEGVRSTVYFYSDPSMSEDSFLFGCEFLYDETYSDLETFVLVNCLEDYTPEGYHVAAIKYADGTNLEFPYVHGAEGFNLYVEFALDACQTHTEETVPGYAATCTEPGLTDGVKCSVCGETLTAQEEIPAGHSYDNDVCTVCGHIGVPVKLDSASLSFKEKIHYNIFFSLGLDETVDLSDMGLIMFDSLNADGTMDDAIATYSGAVEVDGKYMIATDGVHAKRLGDTIYFRVYAKLADGSYVYSKTVEYSAVTYAEHILAGDQPESAKALVVAMLNYGAAAQKFFGYNTDNLVNAFLTEEQKALPEQYRDDMVNTVPVVAAEKQGIFANNKGFSKRMPAVSFEGAFEINYFFTPAYAPVDGITLYYWTEADFDANEVLTVDNATGSLKQEGTGTEQYRGDIEGIAAKNLSDNIYVAAIYSDGTTTWTSGVLGYSIGAYCGRLAAKGGTIADLAMATAVYGYHAKAFFG